MAWARYGATPLGLAGFESLTLFQSLYLDPLPAVPPPSAAPALSQHVILIVLDGLRVDASRSLPTLNRLRTDGVDRTMGVGQPSYSLPGWTVIGTGAWQEQSGIASNFTEDPIALDTIFLALQRAGRSTAIVGSDGWEQLYASGVDEIHVFGDPEGGYIDYASLERGDDRVLAAAQEALEGSPNFLLVHFLGPDNAGHGWGAESEEYRRISVHADALIDALLEGVDLSTSTVLVTADHGHVDRGGHGGGEPEVLEVPFLGAGSGLRPGVYPAATQADLAATIAALLGSGIPSHNFGRPLLDQLEAPVDWKAAWAITTGEQRSARIESMLTAIGSHESFDARLLDEARAEFEAGRFEAAFLGAEQFEAHLDETWQAARAERIGRDRIGRLPWAIGVLLPFAALGIYAGRKRWNLAVPVAGAAAYFALWYANYFGLQRLWFSASLFNTEDAIEPFLQARVMEGVIALALVSIAVGVASRGASVVELLRRGILTHAAVAFGLAVQILTFYVLWGAVLRTYLPDLAAGFKYYLDVFQTTIFWPVFPLPIALLLPILTLVGSWSAGWIGAWIRPTLGRS